MPAPTLPSGAFEMAVFAVAGQAGSSGKLAGLTASIGFAGASGAAFVDGFAASLTGFAGGSPVFSVLAAACITLSVVGCDSLRCVSAAALA